jgi:hypothetical protein
MERIDKVIGNGQGPYNIDIGEAIFGGVEVHTWAASHYNYDRILLRLTPEQAEELAASLIRFAERDRENSALQQSREAFDARQRGEL